MGRPAQEVAPVREQGADRRRHGRRRRAGAARRVLRDLPRDRGPRRVPHPCRVGLPRRVGGLRAGRPGAAAVRRAARRHAGRDAVPRPRGHAGRRAVRRHDPGRRRQPRELPAQVGGDPQLARAGRDDATTCGASPTPGSPTSRRASAGREIHYVGAYDLVLDPLGRRTYAVARRPPASGSSGCATACRAARRPPGTRADGGGDGGDA